jgi:nucleoside-diphosphate-sugar epimerase
MNILVTGSAGFIGSHLCEKLLSLSHKVIGIDNFDPFYSQQIKEKNLMLARQLANFKFYKIDITEKEQLFSLPEPVEAIIHLAAKAGVLPSIQDPGGYLTANIVGTQNLLDFMKERGVKKYIFASSSSVYGNNLRTPFSEADAVDYPISPYASTKKAGELINHTYHYLYNIDILNLRFFTVYGPRQRPDLAIHKFFKLISAGQPVPVYGDGSTARDYTFVHDTVDGIIRALDYLQQREKVYDTINLGNNKPVKLKELVRTIFEVLEKEPDVKYLPMQPGDVDITYADISKAKRLLGYNPQTTLKEGLLQFRQWLQESAQVSMCCL